MFFLKLIEAIKSTKQTEHDKLKSVSTQIESTAPTQIRSSVLKDTYLDTSNKFKELFRNKLDLNMEYIVDKISFTYSQYLNNLIRKYISSGIIENMNIFIDILIDVATNNPLQNFVTEFTNKFKEIKISTKFLDSNIFLSKLKFTVTKEMEEFKFVFVDSFAKAFIKAAEDINNFNDIFLKVFEEYPKHIETSEAQFSQQEILEYLIIFIPMWDRVFLPAIKYSRFLEEIVIKKTCVSKSISRTNEMLSTKENLYIVEEQIPLPEAINNVIPDITSPSFSFEPEVDFEEVSGNILNNKNFDRIDEKSENSENSNYFSCDCSTYGYLSIDGESSEKIKYSIDTSVSDRFTRNEASDILNSEIVNTEHTKAEISSLNETNLKCEDVTFSKKKSSPATDNFSSTFFCRFSSNNSKVLENERKYSPCYEFTQSCNFYDNILVNEDLSKYKESCSSGVVESSFEESNSLKKEKIFKFDEYNFLEGKYFVEDDYDEVIDKYHQNPLKISSQKKQKIFDCFKFQKKFFYRGQRPEDIKPSNSGLKMTFTERVRRFFINFNESLKNKFLKSENKKPLKKIK